LLFYDVLNFLIELAPFNTKEEIHQKLIEFGKQINELIEEYVEIYNSFNGKGLEFQEDSNKNNVANSFFLCNFVNSK